MSAELQWRRKWKPDLASCSWQYLDLQRENKDGNRYFVKAKFQDNSYEILITDLNNFWGEKLTDTALKKRIAKLNPSIEAPLVKILDQIQASLEKTASKNQDSTKLTLTQKAEDVVSLEVSTQLAGMPFVFRFHCEADASGSLGRDHMTLPLMAMVGELYRQQRELFSLLAAKDKEIDDYRAQGVTTSRKHIQTVPFDVLAFRNNMLTSKSFEQEVESYGQQVFSPLGQELYREIVTKRLWLDAKADGGENQTLDGGASGEGPPPGGPSVESWASRLPTSLAGNPSPTKSTSPTKSSPRKSPGSSGASSTEASPVKDSEFLRRQALERKLEQEEAKQTEKVVKKKKKLKF